MEEIKKTVAQRFRNLLKKYNDYDRETYAFLFKVLDYTMKNVTKRINGHLSAHEILEGWRLYSIDQFGGLVKTVMDVWGTKTSDDIGKLVFRLIEFKLCGKNDRDKQSDFTGVYDFEKIFDLKPVVSYDYERRAWKVGYIQKGNT